MVAFYHDWNWNEADEFFRRSLEASPNRYYGSYGVGLGLCAVGRFAEGLDWLERAAEVESMNLANRAYLCAFHVSSRNYERGIGGLRALLTFDSEIPVVYYWLWNVYGWIRDYEQSIWAFQELHKRIGLRIEALIERYREEGYRSFSLGWAEKQERARNRGRYAQPLEIARCYALRGEVDAPSNGSSKGSWSATFASRGCSISHRGRTHYAMIPASLI